MSRFNSLKGWQVDRSAIAILQEAVTTRAQLCGEDHRDSVRSRLHDSEARALGLRHEGTPEAMCEEH